MNKNYEIDKGKYSKRFVPCSCWEDSFTNYIINNKITELGLNYAKGFEGDNLDFLEKLTHLKVLNYINHFIDDLSPIHNLSLLRSLSINSYDNSEINFTKFPYLEHCFLEWRPRAKSLFNCKFLKYLHIEHYKDKSTEKFSNLTNLEKLCIGNSPINDLSGFEKLKKLKFLGLYLLRKLEKLDGLEKLEWLEELEIDGCKKIYDLEPLGKLINLRCLSLCNDGKLKSLLPIKKMKNLEVCFFYDETIIEDGDLYVLWNMKNLKDVAFAKRRHYTHDANQIRMKIKSTRN